MRTLDGKRPVFVDDMSSVFFFPYLHIRFVEIPPARSSATALAGRRPRSPALPARAARRTTEDEADLEIDEDFLRRIREV